VAELLARSPISPDSPVAADGWEVSGLRSSASLTLTDLTPLAKVAVRGQSGGAMAHALGVPFGRAARDGDGVLVIGSGPGEWLALGPVGQASALRGRLEQTVAGAAAGELVTVLDLTHGRALLRLTGARAAATLAKVCGIDLADARVPNGAAFRSSVARLVTDVVRDDRSGSEGQARSYLLHCERSYGQYLFDALLDAGAEFGIAIDGFRAPGI
jgi:heterotetrameric sarcosine oxidase gamma subunit